jgi:hypothetical protein
MYAFAPVSIARASIWETVTGSVGFTTGTLINAGVPVVVNLATPLIFQGNAYNVVTLDARGGGVSFRATAGSTSTTLLTAIASTDAGSIVGMGGTISGVTTTSASTCLYAFVNSKHVFEWKNVQRQTGEAISFQIQVNSSGRIDIVYDNTSTTNPTTSANHGVGLRTYISASPAWPANIQNLTRSASTTCDWASVVSGSASGSVVAWGAANTGPSTGANLDVYRFTPQTFTTATSVTRSPSGVGILPTGTSTATVTLSTGIPNDFKCHSRY